MSSLHERRDGRNEKDNYADKISELIYKLVLNVECFIAQQTLKI